MEIKYFEFAKHLIRFNRQVYLDHNATTPVSDHVRNKMDRVLKSHYGNPSSFYGIGRKSAGLLEEAREQVANAIHANPYEVIFTPCATQSNNAVLKSVAAKEKDHFYTHRTSFCDEYIGVFGNSGSGCRILPSGRQRTRATR